MRSELGSLLNGTAGLRVVSEHPTAEDALERLSVGATQVALVDIQLPGLSGIECTRRLSERDRDLLILMLTVHEDATRLFESLRAGAVGYILKRDPPGDIVRAIFDAVAGGAPCRRPSRGRSSSLFACRYRLRFNHRTATPASARASARSWKDWPPNTPTKRSPLA